MKPPKPNPLQRAVIAAGAWVLTRRSKPEGRANDRRHMRKFLTDAFVDHRTREIEKKRLEARAEAMRKAGYTDFGR